MIKMCLIASHALCGKGVLRLVIFFRIVYHDKLSLFIITTELAPDLIQKRTFSFDLCAN